MSVLPSALNSFRFACPPKSSWLSRTSTFAPGRSRVKKRAADSPLIPPPTITRSYCSSGGPAGPCLPPTRACMTWPEPRANSDGSAPKTSVYGDRSDAPMATRVPLRKSRRVILSFTVLLPRPQPSIVSHGGARSPALRDGIRLAGSPALLRAATLSFDPCLAEVPRNGIALGVHASHRPPQPQPRSAPLRANSTREIHRLHRVVGQQLPGGTAQPGRG